jgi:hypothetical protein
VTHTADIDALADFLAEPLREYLTLYTFPANYPHPYGNQTHADVARRCAPILAAHLASRLLTRPIPPGKTE